MENNDIAKMRRGSIKKSNEGKKMDRYASFLEQKEASKSIFSNTHRNIAAFQEVDRNDMPQIVDGKIGLDLGPIFNLSNPMDEDTGVEDTNIEENNETPDEVADESVNEDEVSEQIELLDLISDTANQLKDSLLNKEEDIEEVKMDVEPLESIEQEKPWEDRAITDPDYEAAERRYVKEERPENYRDISASRNKKLSILEDFDNTYSNSLYSIWKRLDTDFLSRFYDIASGMGFPKENIDKFIGAVANIKDQKGRDGLDDQLNQLLNELFAAALHQFYVEVSNLKFDEDSVAGFLRKIKSYPGIMSKLFDEGMLTKLIPMLSKLINPETIAGAAEVIASSRKFIKLNELDNIDDVGSIWQGLRRKLKNDAPIEDRNGFNPMSTQIENTMYTKFYDRAKEAGYTDGDILSFLREHPEGNIIAQVLYILRPSFRNYVGKNPVEPSSQLDDGMFSLNSSRRFVKINQSIDDIKGEIDDVSNSIEGIEDEDEQEKNTLEQMEDQVGNDINDILNNRLSNRKKKWLKEALKEGIFD